MEKRSIETLSLSGGSLCIDFINTVHDRFIDDAFDYLSGYGKILEWSVKAGSLRLSERKSLESQALKNKVKADNAFDYCIETREALYSLFLPIAQKRIPGSDEQRIFNSILSEGMSHLYLKVSDNMTVRKQWQNDSDLRFPLFPIVQSAYDLLTSDMLDRVKECGACGWLFLDQSKNKSRKWCSMQDCGSNVKAKRYYHKNKKVKTE